MPARDDQRGILKFSARLLKRYPRRSMVILSCFSVGGLMEGLSAGLLLPLFTKMGQENVQPDQAGGTSVNVLNFFDGMFEFLGIEQGVGSLLVMIILLFLVKALLQFFAMREVGNASASMTAELRHSFIKALMNARWSYFTSLPTGQVINSLIGEADRSALSYLYLCKVLADIILVSVYLVAALFISWKVTLAAVVAGFILMMAMYKLVYVVKVAARQQTELFRSLSNLIANALASFKPVKAMGRVEYFHDLMSRETMQLLRARKKEVMGTEMMASVRDPLLVCLVTAGLYACYTYAGLSLSTLLVLAFMFLRVTQKLTFIQFGYQRVASQESAYWALMGSIEQAENAQEIYVGTKTPALSRDIRFEGVSFAHMRDGSPQKILDKVDCLFPVNKLSAIIGASGSGKTTLLDIILGFYKPEAGRVLIDGVSIEDINIAAWRDMIGYIPQEGFLLHDTVWNNITLGQEMSRERVEAALEKADIKDFVMGLPSGLDTVAGERGLQFSGGQRQRMTLARALARDPVLLLLDEPTSALDKDTETQLLKTLKELARTMTVVVISHSERMKTAADYVYTLEHGHLSLDESKNQRAV